MKTRINRVLLPIFALLLLSGCANIQSHPLYSAWQERAYSAYGLPVPASGGSPFMDAVMPYNFNNGNGLSYKSQDGGISRTSDVMSQAEQQYISQYYALQ